MAEEGAVDDLEIVDADLCFPLGVTGVEVRMPVVVENIAITIPWKRLDRWHAAITRR